MWFDTSKRAAFKQDLDGVPVIAQPASVNFLGKYSGWAYAVLRIIAGLCFATHGAQKVFGMFGGKVATAGHMMFAGWVELVGGLLIALGLVTRPAASTGSTPRPVGATDCVVGLGDGAPDDPVGLTDETTSMITNISNRLVG